MDGNSAVNTAPPTKQFRIHARVSPEYTLKDGRLGILLDHLFIHLTYKKGIESLLQGLKQFVEAS